MEVIGVFTSTGVTGYKAIRVTFCNVFKWRKVTLLPCYRVTPVLVNTPIVFSFCLAKKKTPLDPENTYKC